jgi:hypothetical protein
MSRSTAGEVAIVGVQVPKTQRLDADRWGARGLFVDNDPRSHSRAQAPSRNRSVAVVQLQQDIVRTECERDCATEGSLRNHRQTHRDTDPRHPKTSGAFAKPLAFSGYGSH